LIEKGRERDRLLRTQEKEKELEEIKECTFEPYVSPRSRKIAANCIGKTYESV